MPPDLYCSYLVDEDFPLIEYNGQFGRVSLVFNNFTKLPTNALPVIFAEELEIFNNQQLTAIQTGFGGEGAETLKELKIFNNPKLK